MTFFKVTETDTAQQPTYYILLVFHCNCIFYHFCRPLGQGRSSQRSLQKSVKYAASVRFTGLGPNLQKKILGKILSLS